MLKVSLSSLLSGLPGWNQLKSCERLGFVQRALCQRAAGQAINVRFQWTDFRTRRLHKGRKRRRDALEWYIFETQKLKLLSRHSLVQSQALLAARREVVQPDRRWEGIPWRHNGCI